MVSFRKSVLRNLDLNVKVKFFNWLFWQVNIGKCKILLLPLDSKDSKSGIYHRMAPLRMLNNVTFTYIFKVTNFEILKTVKASEKCSCITFIEGGICHRMGPFLMLYYVTLIYIFKVKLFKWLFWQINAEKNVIGAIK